MFLKGEEFKDIKFDITTVSKASQPFRMFFSSMAASAAWGWLLTHDILKKNIIVEQNELGNQITYMKTCGIPWTGKDHGASANHLGLSFSSHILSNFLINTNINIYGAIFILFLVQ